uniref:Retrotransposon Copia-like N-terminal domain-containing protein n=1 Tax=Oryza brachyantha TaxID=4533 RepID=J3LIT7_ORYBR
MARALVVLNNDSAQIKDIEQLNGTNFHEWKEQMQVTLGLLKYDIVIPEDSLIASPDDAPPDVKKAHEERAGIWEEANPMALMVIKNSISSSMRVGIPDVETTKDYLANVE